LTFKYKILYNLSLVSTAYFIRLPGTSEELYNLKIFKNNFKYIKKKKILREKKQGIFEDSKKIIENSKTFN